MILVLLGGLATSGYAAATPSADFNERDGEIFDDWGIYRTRAFGEDGFYQVTKTSFRPVIAFESLGDDADLAYELGEKMAGKYPDRLQRAEAIFLFVRNRVNYATDIDQFRYDEFAQNADELAMAVKQNGVGYGDCEDSAVLLAVMYQGAGYRSAIVVSSGHTAALVYLPEYKKATAFFKLKGESGWVWAEATGRNNPLGWVPKEFINTQLAAYEIGEEPVTPLSQPSTPAAAVAATGGGGISFPFPFLSIIAFLWLISLFRRKH